MVDPTFNGGTPTPTPTPTVASGFTTEGSVTQTDGKTVLAGRIGSLDNGTAQAEVERLNTDGSLDTTFGNGGKIVTAAGSNDAAFAVVLEPNGNIVTAGTHNGEFALREYQPNGSADVHFGHGGLVLTDLGGSATAYTLALEPDGSIVVGGGAGGSFAFARYLPSGASTATLAMAASPSCPPMEQATWSAGW